MAQASVGSRAWARTTRARISRAARVRASSSRGMGVFPASSPSAVGTSAGGGIHAVACSDEGPAVERPRDFDSLPAFDATGSSSVGSEFSASRLQP